MYTLKTPFYGRKQFLRRQRPIQIRTLSRRYQLAELFGLIGAIALVWLGVQLENRLSAAPPPESSTVVSPIVDLTIGVPVGQRRSPQ